MMTKNKIKLVLFDFILILYHIKHVCLLFVVEFDDRLSNSATHALT
jgi:hypothetical protein